MTEREQFAKDNAMSMDFVNWFFDNKKNACGNVWFMMAAAMWEGWKGLASQEPKPLQVTDGMALDFHHALTDGSIGNDELEEIKIGLRAALCNVVAPPAPAVLEAITTAPPEAMRCGSAASYVMGWNAYRFVMLAQPLGSYYAVAQAVPEAIITAPIEAMRCDPAVSYIMGWNACRSAMLTQHLSEYTLADDTKRMDWLVAHHVSVRKPLRYGSEAMFTAQTITDEEDDYHATKLREQIDAAMKTEATKMQI